VRPGLMTVRPHSRLFMASSPLGESGVLYETYKRYYGEDDARCLVWRAPSLMMNPTLSAEEIAAEIAKDPVKKGAEYNATFIPNGEGWLPREVIAGAIVRGRWELAPAKWRYLGFTDPSGGVSDSYTLTIAHNENGRAVVDCVREVKPPFSAEQVTAEFAATLQSYGLNSVRGDRYGGVWVQEAFRKHGIRYEVSEKTASDLYKEAIPLFTSGRVELVDIARLEDQLVSLERRVSWSGRDQVSHPIGGHDDVANAVCGALVMTAGAGLETWSRYAGRIGQYRLEVLSNAVA
jgi:hypothetical protein